MGVVVIGEQFVLVVVYLRWNVLVLLWELILFLVGVEFVEEHALVYHVGLVLVASSRFISDVFLVQKIHVEVVMSHFVSKVMVVHSALALVGSIGVVSRHHRDRSIHHRLHSLLLLLLVLGRLDMKAFRQFLLADLRNCRYSVALSDDVLQLAPLALVHTYLLVPLLDRHTDAGLFLFGTYPWSNLLSLHICQVQVQLLANFPLGRNEYGVLQSSWRLALLHMPLCLNQNRVVVFG